MLNLICESMWTSLGVSMLFDECTIVKIKKNVTHLDSVNDTVILVVYTLL